MTNRNTRSGFRAGRNQDAVQENIELLTGQRGNGLDRAVTVRELAQLGLIGVARNGVGNVIAKPLPPTISGMDKPVGVPHAPSGFMGYGGFGSIMLEWQLPKFKGFAYAEIYRATPNADGTAPTLEQAVLIATTPATVFGDVVNPGSTFYYWCRFVNVNNVAGPYNDVDGIKVSTSQNIRDIIDDIGVQMQGSELIQGLIDDISNGDSALQATIDKAKEDLVIADSALQESINNAKDAFGQEIARVEDEYKGADAEASSAIKGIEQAVANTNNAIAGLGSQIRTEFKDADKAVQSSIIELDKALSSADQALAEKLSQIEVDFKASDSELSGAISELSQVVATDDNILAQQISQMDAAFKVTGESMTQTTNAKIKKVQQTSADADRALAQIITQLEASYQKGDDKLSGAIIELDKVTAERNKVVSDKVDTVQSAVNGVSATVQQNSSAISEINKDGSSAHKAMWGTKAQSGDIKVGIGILASSDGTSQVAVSASQFFVFDPNNADAIQPLFAIDKGNVVIPKALIESATIQILNAQKIVADEVKAGVSITSPLIKGGSITGGWAKFGPGGDHEGYHTHITSDGTIYTDNIIATNGKFTGLVEGSSVRGSTITGSAIQASYIAADVRMLTLTWANQEQYGSMSVENLESRGITPYMGFNTGVTGSQSVRDSSAIAYIDIKSYDFKNKGEYIRYTRKLITPSIVGSGMIYRRTYRTYGGGAPSHSCGHTIKLRVEIYHDGSHIRTVETGWMSNGQSVNHADFKCKAKVVSSTVWTGSGHSNQGDWDSYLTECYGYFDFTMKQHAYSGSRGRIGLRAYVYNHVNSQWIIANEYTASDTALNDYSPSSEGPE